MSYCINPDCPHPLNSNDVAQCQQCGEVLRLNHRYLALKPIGQGGFGRTFLAVDEFEQFKPRCVIKQFLPQQLGANHREKASALFRQEAQRLIGLGDHPQIPDLLAYIEQNDRQYLVQEFVDGVNLAQELETGIFNAAQIYQLLDDLLPVLQYVHQHQVIHRDIKPANIIRRAIDQKLFLVDLGAAKQATGTALGMTGTVIGSAEYTAPEQSRGKAVFASDLYSLGVTCLHLLTGMSPFDLYDSSEGCWIWRNYTPEAIDGGLSRILDKMVAGPTNQRYQSATAILSNLNQRHSAKRPDDENSGDAVPRRDDWSSPLFNNEYWSSPPFDEDLEETQLNVVGLSASTNVSFEARGELTPTASFKNVWRAGRIGGTLLILLSMMYLARLVIGSQLSNPAKQAPPISIPSAKQAPIVSTPSAMLKLSPVPTPIQTFSAQGKVASLAISSDGKILVSGNDDSRSDPTTGNYHSSNLQVWDLPTGKVLHTLTSPYPVWSVAISPDGKTLASQSVNAPMKADFRAMFSMLGQLDNDRFGGPRGPGAWDLRGTLQLWDLQTGQPLQTLAAEKHTLVMGSTIAFTPDGKFLAGSSPQAQTDIWEIATSKKVRTLPANNGIVSFDANQTALIMPMLGRPSDRNLPSIEKWNWRTGQQIADLLTQTTNCGNPLSSGSPAKASICGNRRLAINQKRHMVAITAINTAAENSSVLELCFLGTDDWKCSPPQPIDMDEVESVAISPDGLIATAGAHNSRATINLFGIVADDLKQLGIPRLIRMFNTAAPKVTSVVFTPDGKQLITANSAGKIEVWRVDQLVTGK